VSIRAEIPIGTLDDRVGIVEAEILLVFLVAVVFLNKRMRVDAVFPVRTFLFLFDKLAHLRRIEIAVAFPIFSVMIIHAVLVIVVFSNVARVHLKVI